MTRTNHDEVCSDSVFTTCKTAMPFLAEKIAELSALLAHGRGAKMLSGVRLLTLLGWCDRTLGLLQTLRIVILADR